MARSRQDIYTDATRHDAHCVDCDARFTITLYTGDTPQQAFPRDHPQNGCYVKDVRAVRTKRLRK